MTLQTDNMRESSVLTNELMMRVLQVESPELFDGSDKEPVEVTDYKRKKWEICPYGTCVFLMNCTSHIRRAAENPSDVNTMNSECLKYSTH